MIVSGGRYVATRLLQSGPRTFPYFQEASDRVIGAGELVAFDADTTAGRGTKSTSPEPGCAEP